MKKPKNETAGPFRGLLNLRTFANQLKQSSIGIGKTTRVQCSQENREDSWEQSSKRNRLAEFNPIPDVCLISERPFSLSMSALFLSRYVCLSDD